MNDYQTSTVEGAKGFAKVNHVKEYFYDEYCDWDYDIENDDEEEDCNCSDPGCPCNGNKKY